MELTPELLMEIGRKAKDYGYQGKAYADTVILELVNHIFGENDRVGRVLKEQDILNDEALALLSNITKAEVDALKREIEWRETDVTTLKDKVHDLIKVNTDMAARSFDLQVHIFDLDEALGWFAQEDCKDCGEPYCTRLGEEKQDCPCRQAAMVRNEAPKAPQKVYTVDELVKRGYATQPKEKTSDE